MKIKISKSFEKAADKLSDKIGKSIWKTLSEGRDAKTLRKQLTVNTFGIIRMFIERV